MLEDCLTIASEHPVNYCLHLWWYLATQRSQNLLSSHYTRFFVYSLDGPATKRVKMHILLALLRESSALPLLKEFEVEKGSITPGYTLTICK